MIKFKYFYLIFLFGINRYKNCNLAFFYDYLYCFGRFLLVIWSFALFLVWQPCPNMPLPVTVRFRFYMNTVMRKTFKFLYLILSLSNLSLICWIRETHLETG